MKKILSISLVTLMLCTQHESSAMAAILRNSVIRAQQYSKTLTQQVAPVCRSLSSGIRQQVPNIGPQASQLFRNMQTSMRNCLPSMRTSATLLSGAGLGTAALQRPDIFGVVRAEEETESPDLINEKKANLIFEQLVSGKSFDQFRNIEKALEANSDLTEKLADIVESEIKILHLFLDNFSHVLIIGDSNPHLQLKLARLYSIQHDIKSIQRKLNLQATKSSSSWWPFK